MHEVRDYESRYNVSTCIAYERVKAKHQNSDSEAKFPSRATVYRYLKADRTVFLCSAATKTRAIDSSSRRPHRGAGCRQGEGAHRDGIPMVTAHGHQALQPLLKASSNISRKFVSKVVFEHISSDIDYDRMDPRTRAACKAVAKNRIRVDGFLHMAAAGGPTDADQAFRAGLAWSKGANAGQVCKLTRLDCRLK